MEYRDLELAVRHYDSDSDLGVLEKAYAFSKYHHRNQRRKSGEPYFIHLHETALIAAQMQLDVETIVCALLHDTVEDTEVTCDQLRSEFGDTVAEVVAGVTKVGKLGEAKEVNKAETVRRILKAAKTEVRVVLVKLCDRLHNMRTNQFLPEHKRRRKALESLEIYAPLADKLGIRWARDELLDLSLQDAHPAAFSRITDFLNTHKEERLKSASDLSNRIQSALDEVDIQSIIEVRTDTVHSIWLKMRSRMNSLKEMGVPFSLLVVTNSIPECYRALGVIHSLWSPLPGTFEDCVAMPRHIYSRCLKSSIVLPDGRKVVVRIRTPHMVHVSENGILSAEGEIGREANYSTGVPSWLSDFVDAHENIANPDEFLKTIEEDLKDDVIALFTPKGETVRLPEKSTALDFAYAIKEELGNQAVAARINGRVTALTTKLRNGDIVEITRGLDQKPQRSWLSEVRTARARQAIRTQLKLTDKREAQKEGRRQLLQFLGQSTSFRKAIETKEFQAALARMFEMNSVEELFSALGFGVIDIERAARHIIENAEMELALHDVVNVPERSRLSRMFKEVSAQNKERDSFIVDQQVKGVVRLARCCRPLYGERIRGLRHGNRGVSVHRARCSRILNAPERRVVEVSWKEGVEVLQKITLQVRALQRRTLLSEICVLAASADANIQKADFTTSSYGHANLQVVLELSSYQQCDTVILGIEALEGVFEVKRVHAGDETVTEPSPFGLVSNF